MDSHDRQDLPTTRCCPPQPLAVPCDFAGYVRCDTLVIDDTRHDEALRLLEPLIQRLKR